MPVIKKNESKLKTFDELWKRNIFVPIIWQTLYRLLKEDQTHSKTSIKQEKQTLLTGLLPVSQNCVTKKLKLVN